MFWIHWIAYPAVGILIYLFLSLLYWDLYRFLPTPLGNCYEDGHEKEAKSAMKTWMFFIGCAFVACTILVSRQLWGIHWLNSYDPDSVLTWAMLLGFSTPITALFLLRIVVFLGFAIYALYAEAEALYDKGKALLVKQLRKTGHIE